MVSKEEKAKAAEALVMAATQETLGSSPDWGVNVQIVDMLNADPTTGEPVAKALKKQLKVKSNVVALLGISLLDMLVKSCPQFHQHVGNKDFMQAFVKTLPEKIRDPQKKSLFKLNDGTGDMNASERVDRTLVLIEQWAKAFAKSRSFPIFKEIYDELLGKGVKFPEPLKDELAPVFTPPVNTAAKEKEKEKLKAEAEKAAAAARDAPFRDVECAAASENAKLLYDMLTASEEGSDLTRNELVQTLLINVRASQAALMSRLSQPVHDWQMAELLRANDFCAEAMQYYEGLRTNSMKRRPRVTPEQKAVAAATEKSKAPPKDEKKPTALAPPPSGAAADDDDDDDEEETPKQPENKRGGGAAAAGPAQAISPTTNMFDFFTGAAAAPAPVQLQPVPTQPKPVVAAQPAQQPVAQAPTSNVTVPKLAPPKLAPPPVTPSAKGSRAAAAASSASPATPSVGPTPMNTPAPQPQQQPAAAVSQPAQPAQPTAVNLDLLWFGHAAAGAQPPLQPVQPIVRQPQPAQPAQMSPFDLPFGAVPAVGPAAVPASRFPPAFPAAAIAPAAAGSASAVSLAQRQPAVAVAPVAATTGGGFDDDFDPFSQIAARKVGSATGQAAAPVAAAAAAAADDDDDLFAAIALRKA